MSGGVGRQLKAAAAFLIVFAFLLAAFAGLSADKAGARASQRAYMTAGPNTWEFMGFNATGTAAKFIVDHQGWNVSRTFGNVGIGDGSVRALNMSSNVNDINYTEKNFMAGDISSAPWDPARITDYSVSEENIPDRNASTTNETLSKNTSKSSGKIGMSTTIGDPFHTMLLGRPVNDLLYEHPHAISANMYARLVGISMPGGRCANVGMRAIGYGY